MSRYLAPAALMVCLLLASCATPLAVVPGASEAEVVARFGAPADRHALADGGTRFEYRTGPLAQQKYMVDLDAGGRVRAVAQVHDFDRFMKIRTGADTAADIRRNFGEPRLVQRYLSGLTAWLYPYIEAGSFNSEMAVYFDDSGIVRRVESGPDPRFLRGSGDRND